jgi:hypothetical protein
MSQYTLAKEILNRAFPNKKLISQNSDLWKGDFALPEAIAEYYRDFGAFNLNIDSYGNDFFFPSLENLWKCQNGYRFHGITNERVEDWEDDWIVIADQGADPFIYSISTGKILFDYHGQGKWEPGETFSDLPSMINSLLILGEIVVGAGEDFTNEEGYINKRFIDSAKENLSHILNSKVETESVLDTFGWSN